MADDPRQTFERLYRDDPDPWDFATSPYEIAKRAQTLAALPEMRFASVLEVGCGPGFLTLDLAAKADRLLALDISQEAIGMAKARTASLPHVACRRAAVPADWPEGTFDLIVLSEVLYFLPADDIAHVSRLSAASLRPGGACLLVNWTGENDLPVSGDEAVERFGNAAAWQVAHADSRESYRIDLLRR